MDVRAHTIPEDRQALRTGDHDLNLPYICLVSSAEPLCFPLTFDGSF